MTICPAPIFAVSRTERVIGRTNALIVSTKTKKGTKKKGTPTGKKWEKKLTGLQKKLDKSKLIHKGKAKEKEITRCLVLLKT